MQKGRALRTKAMGIDDIAKALGVSKTTVSRAMNGTGRMSPQTRSRILSFIKEVGFIPNAAAGSLATTRTRNIAYAMPLRDLSVRSSYFTECMFGVSSVAAKHGYSLTVVDERVDALTKIAASHQADGIVLSAFDHDDAELEQLGRYGVPIVLTGSCGVSGVIQVQYNSRPAFHELTRRLLSDTWRTPMALLLTEHDSRANISRAECFRQAMVEGGVREPLILWDLLDAQAVRDTLLKLYRQGILGIICGDDAICADVVHALDRARRAPDRELRAMAQTLRLASFHRNRMLRDFFPDIPAVESDPNVLGQRAAETLIQQIEQGSAVTVTYLPSALSMDT